MRALQRPAEGVEIYVVPLANNSRVGDDGIVLILSVSII